MMGVALISPTFTLLNGKYPGGKAKSGGGYPCYTVHDYNGFVTRTQV